MKKKINIILIVVAIVVLALNIWLTIFAYQYNNQTLKTENELFIYAKEFFKDPNKYIQHTRRARFIFMIIAYITIYISLAVATTINLTKHFLKSGKRDRIVLKKGYMDNERNVMIILKEYNDLLNEGVITEEDYLEKKQQLLNNN